MRVFWFPILSLIEVARSVPVEMFDDYPFLGRFTLRMESVTVAFGWKDYHVAAKEGVKCVLEEEGGNDGTLRSVRMS